MIPDLPGALVALMDPARGHGRRLLGGTFDVDPGGATQPAAALQPRGAPLEHTGGEWRIEEDDIERLRRRGEKRFGIGGEHAPVEPALRVELRQALLDRAGRLPLALDEGHVRGAARERLEPERAAAGEQIQTSRARHEGREPVEQCLAHPIGRGADGGRSRKAQAPPAPCAADDAQHPRSTAAPVRVGRIAHALSFERADRAATIH